MTAEQQKVEELIRNGLAGKLTPEQQKDEERLDRYIVREGLASVMNKTKWREAIQVLKDVMTSGVRFRIKDVRGSEPRANYWDGSFPYHVGNVKS